jgi:hypothetical protein
MEDGSGAWRLPRFGGHFRIQTVPPAVQMSDPTDQLGERMRKLVVLLAAVAFAACTTTPTPATVTEQLAHLRVTHPAAWTSVPGPGPVGDGDVPLFYLSDATLTVTCPPPPSGGVFEGCPAPITMLPTGSVLVTVSGASNLNEPVVPQINVGSPTDDWPGPCRSIGGERQLVSVLDGVIVSACLRGPNLDEAEAEVRAMIASLAQAG